jgi:hypothetical protein
MNRHHPCSRFERRRYLRREHARRRARRWLAGRIRSRQSTWRIIRRTVHRRWRYAVRHGVDDLVS